MMIITRKTLSRRTVLRSVGATLALPMLDSMVPALTALGRTVAKPVSRLGVIYVPNGIMMEHWTPATEGAGFELTPILQPLERFREQFLVVTGLGVDRIHGGDHSGASTKFLTGVPGRQTAGFDVQAGISMDQIAAKELGRQTQLASLELALESAETTGTCQPGYSCVYSSTIAWRSPTTPLPMEHNPRTVFERLFGDSETTDAKARLARARKDRSLLDSVTSKVTDLQRGLGPGDRRRLAEFVDAVRDVERRIQKVEEQSAIELPVTDRPVGVPATFEEHARLMFDLQVLAYQTDLTRVITFMVGREFSGRSYPEIGVPDAHHPTSHHRNDPDKLAKLVQVNMFHVRQFAYFLEKLASTPDGDGSLLDHIIVMYGCGMSDGNRHVHENLPILLAGGGAGQLKGGRHLRYPKVPVANLHLTLLDKLGIQADRLGDSTSTDSLEGLSGI